MKQTNLLKTFLLLCAMVVGGSAWADTKTEGFETKATSTTYNSTVTVAANESDCGIAWSIYYGTVSTNDKISGSKSAQMRWYASATGNIPYIMTTTAIDGLTNVALKARTSNKDVKMDVCYSADGETWTVGKTHTFSATGTGENVSLDIPSGNKYVKFAVSSSSTAPTSSSYKLIVDDVVFTYSSSLVEPTWSVDPASATVNMGESTNLQLTTNYDGTLNFVSNDEDVATVSYNSKTKVITVSGVSAGSTTITATGSATSNYQAITKNITVLVNYPELPNNVIDVMGPLGYSYFGLNADKGTSPNEYAQPSEASREITDAYGVTLLLEKGESNNNPRYDAKYMRIYQKNTLTITAPTGSYIRKIVFTEPSTEKSWAGSMTADEGIYSEALKTWYANTGDITSVVLTNDATKRIGGIEVYLMKTTPLPITISSATGFATVFTYAPLDFSTLSSELKAYTATVTGNTVTLTQVDNVPANTGIVLKGDVKTHNVPVIASSTTEKGDLTGSVTEDLVYDSEATKDYFYLGINAGKAQFKRLTSGSIGAGKAYLALDKSTTARELDVVFDETTALTLVNSEKRTVNSDIYNLAGQRVAQPTKGLYIVNGRKVVVK